MKVTIAIFDNGEREKGRGFMKREDRINTTRNTEMSVGRSYVTMLLDSRRKLKL